MVGESVVELSKNWVGLLIRPSEKPVQKVNLRNIELVERIVES